MAYYTDLSPTLNLDVESTDKFLLGVYSSSALISMGEILWSSQDDSILEIRQSTLQEYSL